MINYYHPLASEYFDDIVASYPNLKFYQPAPDKAPWHVQCVLDVEGEDDIVLNFWPHKMKGQRQPLHAVEGVAAMHALIEEALRDQADEPFDVIEG